MTKSHLYLQDKDINLNYLTELEDTSVFKIEYMGMRTYEKKEYNVMNDIIVEMNSSLIQVER